VAKDRIRKWSRKQETTGQKMVEEVEKDRTEDGRSCG
jgi:hypothetical protein